MVKAKEEVVISPLLSPSSNSFPSAVSGASNLYFNPVSSTSKDREPTPNLLLANTPLSSL
jgi:hypothetical protein